MVTGPDGDGLVGLFWQDTKPRTSAVSRNQRDVATRSSPHIVRSQPFDDFVVTPWWHRCH